MAKALTARVVKSISLLGSTQGLNMVCTVVRLKVLSVLVGPAGVGLMGALTQSAEMIGNFSQLNIRTTAVRDLASAPRGRFDATLTAVRRYGRLLGAVGAALMFLLAPLLAEFTFPGGGMAWAYRIAAASVLFQALQGSELVVLQATSNYRQIAASSLLTAVVGLLIAVPLYWFLRLDGVAPSIVAYSVVAWLGAMWFSRRFRPQGVRSPWRASLVEGRGFIALGVVLTITALGSDLVNFLFMAFMGRKGETELGLFQAGYTMVWRYAAVFFTAFSLEFYPRLSRLGRTPGRMRPLLTHQSIITTLMLLPCALLVIALAPWIIRLIYSGEFMGVRPYLMWGMAATMVRPFTSTVSYAFLAAGRGRVYALTELTSVAVGLGLNIGGYTLGGFDGLGLAMVVWMTVEALIVGFVARRNGLPVPGRRALLITAASLALTSLAALLLTL